MKGHIFFEDASFLGSDEANGPALIDFEKFGLVYQHHIIIKFVNLRNEKGIIGFIKGSDFLASYLPGVDVIVLPNEAKEMVLDNTTVDQDIVNDPKIAFAFGRLGSFVAEADSQ